MVVGPLGADAVSYTHLHAAAEVRADFGIFQREILDGGTVGAGEQAGVRLRSPQIAVVFQTCDGVAPAVERTLERQVDGAEDQTAVLFRNLEVGFVQSQVVIQNNIDALAGGRMRQIDRVHQVGHAGDMVRICLLYTSRSGAVRFEMRAYLCAHTRRTRDDG